MNKSLLRITSIALTFIVPAWAEQKQDRLENGADLIARSQVQRKLDEWKLNPKTSPFALDSSLFINHYWRKFGYEEQLRHLLRQMHEEENRPFLLFEWGSSSFFYMAILLNQNKALLFRGRKGKVELDCTLTGDFSAVFERAYQLMKRYPDYQGEGSVDASDAPMLSLTFASKTINRHLLIYPAFYQMLLLYPCLEATREWSLLFQDVKNMVDYRHRSLASEKAVSDDVLRHTPK